MYEANLATPPRVKPLALGLLDLKHAIAPTTPLPRAGVTRAPQHQTRTHA
jgi:hypothetical protein